MIKNLEKNNEMKFKGYFSQKFEDDKKIDENI